MWNDLTIQQRADVISMAVKAGMRDMKSIKSFYDETSRSRRFEDGKDTEYERVDDNTPGMTGMMKAALATAAHFGNPTARRMTNYDTRSYVWPDEYEEDGIFVEPKKGNVYVASYDNLVTPRIQDTGNGLTFVNNVWNPENEQRSYSQSLKFNNEEDARYFGEHYKEIAPMMHLYTGGGTAVSQNPYYVNIKNYPVVNAKDEGLSEYFMNHKDVAGMAIGAGANGIDGPRRIVINPYSDVLKTDLQKEGLIRIEAVRHAMEEYNYKPSFKLSKHQKNLQKTVFKNMPYGSNDEAFKRSIISRILAGDTGDLQPTSEQEAEAARFIFNNDSNTTKKPKKFEDGKNALLSSAPKLSNIPKFNFNAPVIEKVTPEYEEIKPKKEIPIEPVKPKESIIPGLSPQQPISDSRFSRSHPIFKDEHDYMNSDAFLTRVKKMTNDNEKARILATNMRNGLYYTKLPNEAFFDYTSNSQNSGYRTRESGPYMHNIYYGQVNDIPGFTKRSVIAHELGHSVYDGNKDGSLLDYHLLSPQYTSVLQRGRHKTPVSDETRRHDHMDTERIADIRALQQQAKDAGIWDKTTGVDMTPESFNKLKQTYPDNRSFDMWNDEDLRWLINTTAQNNTPTLDYSNRNYLLANGGHLYTGGGGIKK